MKIIFGLCCLIFIYSQHSLSYAESDPKSLKNSIHVFAGQYTKTSTGDSANPFTADYENNYLLAIDYGREIINPGWGFLVGLELGLASRFGQDESIETWGALSFRHRGICLWGTLRISFGLSAGLSLVEESIGTEKKRENDADKNASLLFYLGPEIALSFANTLPWELVYRLHHRSGANGTLGNMSEGYNANTLGVRYRF